MSELTGILLFGTEELLDFLAHFSVGNLDVILGIAVIRHQGKKAILGNIQLRCGQ